jgi:hypothetical protein
LGPAAKRGGRTEARRVIEARRTAEGRRTHVPFKVLPRAADLEVMSALSRLVAILMGVLLLGAAGTAAAHGGSDDDKKPEVFGASASDLTSSSALLKGYVDPNEHSTTYQFEFGPTVAYGYQSASGSAGSDDSWHAVSASVTGLQPSSTYHYRLVATSSKGTTRGPDRTFTTLATGAPRDPGTAPPPGGGGEVALEPKLGSSVLVAPGRGELRVRRPRASRFVPLEFGAELPVGSEIDASAGTLSLTAALPSGARQTGQFGGGRFKVRQDKRGYVDLYLRGRYCTKARGSAITTAVASSRRGRRLWGRDHGGRFRTHGRNSHATVRGTRWLVVDTCKGTLTRVTSGSVVVRDEVRRKSIVLDAGERYLARPRR